MRNRAVTGVFVVCFMGFTVYAARADVWDKTWNVAENVQIRLNADDGNIRVEASGTKQVKALVRTVGWRIADDEVRVLEKQVGDRLEIDVKVPQYRIGWRIRREVTVELTVPRSAELDLHTGDGNITTHGADGSLRSDTGDGNVTAVGGKGTIRLHTGDGNITADELDGSLVADTGDGNIDLEGRFEALSVETGDGNVDVVAYAGSRVGSPWRIRTGDGNIVLRLPEGVGADLDASTGDGRVMLDFPVTVSGKVDPSSVRGPMNGGGPPLTVRTGDGNIRIEKR